MRHAIIATALLFSSSLYPAIAQEPPKEAPPTAPQTTPVQPDQNSPQPQQRSERDRGRDGEIGRDWRMRRGESDRIGRDDRESRPEWRGYRDHEEDSDRDRYRQRYGERGERDFGRADRDGESRGYVDDDRPRRRVKICVEYENGDEYCRYRQGR